MDEIKEGSGENLIQHIQQYLYTHTGACTHKLKLCDQNNDAVILRETKLLLLE